MCNIQGVLLFEQVQAEYFQQTWTRTMQSNKTINQNYALYPNTPLQP